MGGFTHLPHAAHASVWTAALTGLEDLLIPKTFIQTLSWDVVRTDHQQDLPVTLHNIASCLCFRKYTAKSQRDRIIMLANGSNLLITTTLRVFGLSMGLHCNALGFRAGPQGWVCGFRPRMVESGLGCLLNFEKVARPLFGLTEPATDQSQEREHQSHRRALK